jgi:hypothetical protein
MPDAYLLFPNKANVHQKTAKIFLAGLRPLNQREPETAQAARARLLGTVAILIVRRTR